MGKKIIYACCVISFFIFIIILLAVKLRSSNSSRGICHSEGCKKVGSDIYQYLDIGTKPCNDFYSFTCGKYFFIDEPRNFSVLSSMKKRLNEEIKEILNSRHKRSPLAIQLASSFYRSCVEMAPYSASKFLSEEIEDEFGGWPVINSVDSSDDFFDWSDFYVTLRINHRANFMIGIYIATHPKDKSRRIINVSLPEKDEIWSIMAKDNFEKYKTFVSKWINMISDTRKNESIEMINQLYKFESSLIRSALVSEANDTKKYLTLGELDQQSYYDQIPLRTIIKQLFYNVSIELTDKEPIYLCNPKYYSELNNLLSKTPKNIVSSYFALKLVSKFAPLLLSLPIDENEKKDKCIQETYKYYSHAIKRMYLERYFDETQKNRIENMIKNIKKYLRNDSYLLYMMDSTTKAALIRKLDSLKYTIGYSDWISNRWNLEEYYIDYPDYVDSNYLLSLIGAFKGIAMKELKKLKSTGLAAQDFREIPSILSVEGYYSRNENRLIYSPGLLRPPVFFVDAPLPINYGALGSIIAKDLIHTFDMIGRNYNEDGRKKDWWTPQYEQHFSNKIKCYQDNYKTILNRNNLTLDSLIARVEGLKLSFETFMRVVSDTRFLRIPKKLDNYSFEQLYFISFAQLWCSKARVYQNQVNKLLENLPQFNEAFNCKRESATYCSL